MKLGRPTLTRELRDIADRIEDGDSFEGSLTYSCMDEDLVAGEFRLVGAVRVGNKDGQGGMRLYEQDLSSGHPSMITQPGGGVHNLGTSGATMYCIDCGSEWDLPSLVVDDCAGKRCRRCSECPDGPHHFIENLDFDDESKLDEVDEYTCKHCEVTAAMCEQCDVAVWPAHASGLCEECRPKSAP